MSFSPLMSRTSTRITVIAAVLAVIFGRALAVALPGSRSGLDKLIYASGALGAFFTQLLAVLIVLVAGRLTFTTWQSRHFGASQRLVVTSAALTVIVLVIAACFDFIVSPSAPEISLILGIAGTLVALDASSVSLRPIRLRASGIVLLLVGAASLLQVSARLLALQASNAALPTQYVVARWLASLATVFDAGAILLTALWVASLWKQGRTALAGVLGLAVSLSELARRATGPKSGFAEVLLSRCLAQLHREPSSLLPRLLQDTQELLALLLALLLLLRPRAAPLEQRMSLAMILLARSSPDIPLCAGLLVTGALGLSLLAAEPNETSTEVEASAREQADHSQPAEPS